MFLLRPTNKTHTFPYALVGQRPTEAGIFVARAGAKPEECHAGMARRLSSRGFPWSSRVLKRFQCSEALRQKRGRLHEGYDHHPAAGVDFSALAMKCFQWCSPALAHFPAVSGPEARSQTAHTAWNSSPARLRMALFKVSCTAPPRSSHRS